MDGHFDRKRAEGGLKLHHMLFALFIMGYAVGSPDLAPLLPQHLERAFARLHKDMNEVGFKAFDSAALTLQRAGLLGN